jgi:putative ABC transport system permease protein
MDSTMWKIALRTLARDKTYALINVAGLALAIACCLILGVYLRSELTYDHSHVNYKKIFRVVNEFEFNGKLDRFAVTSPMLGPMLKEENADVQAYVRFQGGGSNRSFIQHGGDGYYWSNTYVADPNVFEVFTHKILYGDPKTALVSPTSVAVSRTFARKYFGDRNPLGETITSDGNDFQISLVFDDLPENTHLKYDVLFSSNIPLFATPVLAYVVMLAWLRSFAFRTSINPGVFLIAALVGLGIAYLTVALQSLKAARAHPVRALRYE